MDFHLFTVTLLELEAMKMSYLLVEPELQYGVEQVRAKLIRELSGLGQFCVGAEPSLHEELPVVHRMLASRTPGQVYAEPPGSAEAVRAAWEEWHDTVEWMRVLFEIPGWGQSNTPLRAS